MLSINCYKQAINKYLLNSIKTVASQTDKLSAIHCNHVTRRPSSNLGRKEQKLFLNEVSAVINLINRSYNIPKPVIARFLHTTCVRFREPSKPPRDREPKQQNNNEPESQSPRNDESNKNNDGKKDNDEKEKMMSVLSKTLLWMFTIYVMIAFLSLLFSGRSRAPPPDQNMGQSRYVSWNEFVHHMLATGEVKELIVRPDMEMVTIVLHDGAIVKGRKMISTIFYMAIPESDKFEEKLREVERKMAIKDSVNVTYERQSDLVGRILFSLVATGVIIALFSRMRGMKGPLNMDVFVSTSNLEMFLTFV